MIFIHKKRNHRRIVRKQNFGDEESAFRVLSRAADKFQPQMAEAFLSAVASTQGRIIMREVRDAIRQGDFIRAESLIDWDLFSVEFETISRAILRDVIDEAGTNSVRLLPNELRAGISFDVTNPRVEEFLQQKSATLATQITNESRQAIRNQLAKAQREGLGIDTTASMVREFIGLTQRQMQAVDNLRGKLIEQGFTFEEAMQRVIEKRNRLLDFRAENISRTETINASTQGALEMMNQRVEEVGLNKRDFVKVWIVTGDDRTCPICWPLHGQTRGLDELFSTSVGNIDGPTAHPQCRCAISFERRLQI